MPTDLGANEPSHPEPDQMITPKPETRKAGENFRGEKRSNATHASVTDPEARLYRKSPGAGAILCCMGHRLMENRHGFAVQADLTQADRHAARKAALDMIHRHVPGSTKRLPAIADRPECVVFMNEPQVHAAKPR